MSRTINLLSYQMGYSYGAVLAMFALKQIVTRLGYNGRCINLYSHSWENIQFNFEHKGSDKIKVEFDKFRKINFSDSIDLYDNEGKISKFDASDIFIVGSDQVWNVKYSAEYWRDFFLNFVPDKNLKIAYAASLGGKNINLGSSELDEINILLHRFCAISCRENDGVEYLKKQFGVNAIRTIDPTLLDIDYSFLFNPDQYAMNGKFLMFYGFGVDRLVQNEWVRYMAKELDLQVRAMNANPVEADFVYDHYVSPSQWLSGLYNASYIVTNSFHTCCFAIIFKKPFILIPRSLAQTRDEQEYSRYENLFSELNLEDRMFFSYDEIKSDHRWKMPIDYDMVYKNLKPLREHSLNFLKQALNNK
jgi:hypothetical protein